MKWDIHLSAKSKHDLWKSAVVTLLALFVMGLILFPVYYMFVVSLKPVGTLASSSICLLYTSPSPRD
jgi:arabinogalactan oligomer/maltooligosaccharide transport system permease protein